MSEPRFTIAHRGHSRANFGRHKSGWYVCLDGEQITIAWPTVGEAFIHLVRIRQLYEEWGWLGEPLRPPPHRYLDEDRGDDHHY